MSPLRLEYHPHADFEIEEAFEWYLLKKLSPASASRLLDELEFAFKRIVAEPDRWPNISAVPVAIRSATFLITWSIKSWIRSFLSSQLLMSAVVLAIGDGV